MKRIYLLILPLITVFLVTFSNTFSVAQNNSNNYLLSWREITVKTAIVNFVDRTTTPESPDYLPRAKRIAVFDNDGTLWAEKPLIQGMFALEILKNLAEKNPSLKEKQPFKAVLTGDMEYIKQAGEEAVMELLAVTHSYQTQAEFEANVRKFFANGVHPTLRLPLKQLAYQPMLELMSYLREKGFQTWICSGGGIDFIRVVSQEIYGIPPQQVIGSSLSKEFIFRENQGVLVRKPELNSFNDKTMKPVNLDLHIGIIPVFAVGNVRSGGDIAMLTYSQNNPISLQILINHDDNQREFAYTESDNASLNNAQQKNWQVVSMQKDWLTIFDGRKEK